jgi:hypothetical protein
MKIEISEQMDCAIVNDRYEISPCGTVWDTKEGGDIPQSILQIAKVAEMAYENEHVGMDCVCELAHTLTIRECGALHIPVDVVKSDYDQNHDEIEYTPEAQEIYDYYYKVITETLNV